MPEIAEVRTVRDALRKELIGRKIINVNILYSGIVKTDLEEFKSILKNKTFKEITTIGKWIIFNLGEYSLVSHLRMEGKYYYKPSFEPYEDHEHIIFSLDNDFDLRYKDVRKFGVMILCKTSDVMSLPEITKLGIEPDNKSLTKEYLYSKIHDSNKKMKELLLDQTIINGLGNIYVDEVLFASSISPLRLGKDVLLEECELICKEANRIITKSYELGGTTIRSYTSQLGVIGHYQDYLQVHTREGMECPRCKELILKTRVGGRGTYYCPNCQK